MSKDCVATAQVTFTVEMPANSSWGASCSVDQVFDQAGIQAANKLAAILKEHGGKIVGEPKVVAVLASRA